MREVFFLMVLTLWLIPRSGYAQLGEDHGSGFHLEGSKTHAIQEENNTIHLKVENRTHKGLSDDLDSTAYVVQLSDKQKVRHDEQEEARGPARVALMIITLMMSIVVFMANVVDQ